MVKETDRLHLCITLSIWWDMTMGSEWQAPRFVNWTTMHEKRLRLGDLLEYLFPAKNMLQRPDSFRAWTTSSLIQLTDLLWIWYIRSRTSYVLIKDSFVVHKNWCKDRDLELTKSRSSILILYLLNFSVTNAIVNLTCEYNDSNELVKVFERIVETTTWYDDSRDGPGDG